MTLMNSRHLCPHALSPHKLEQAAVDGEGAHRSLPLTAELLATSRFWERVRYNIHLCIHWLAHQTQAHTDNSVPHPTTHKVENRENIFLRKRRDWQGWDRNKRRGKQPYCIIYVYKVVMKKIH